jgi:hypothetical protein
VVLLGPGCKLVRGQTAKAGVRPAGIIVEPSGFNDPPCHQQATEHVLVEALVAEAPVEALDKGVLDRLARRDVGRPYERVAIRDTFLDEQVRTNGKGRIPADPETGLANRSRQGAAERLLVRE